MQDRYAAPSPLHARLLAAAALALIALGLLLSRSPLERELFLRVNAWGPQWPALWAGLSLLGLGLSAALLVGALGPRHAELLARLLLLLLIGGLLVQTLKHALALPRPLAVLGAPAVHVIGDAMLGRSMPSGHSAQAFALAALLLPARAAWPLLALALALAIALSRLAVGAHWPADVLVGAGLGLLCGLLLARLSAAARLAALLRGAPGARLVAIALLLGALPMFFWPLGTPEVQALQWLIATCGLWGAWRWWPRGQTQLQHAARTPLRQWLGLGLLAIAALALLMLGDSAAWRAELLAAHGRLMQLPRQLWALAIAGFALSYALRAWRLQAEWKQLGAASWLECLRLTVQHIAAINLLPLRAGEASLPWQIHRRWGVPLPDAALSLLWIRLQDAAVLGLLGLLLFLPLAWPLRLALAAAALPGLLVLAPRAMALGIARLPWLRRPLAALQGRRPGVVGIACTLGSWTAKLGVIALLMRELAGLDALAALGGALGGELVALWPLQAPAGLGSYEAGVWGGAQLQLLQPLSQAEGARLLIAAFTVHVLSLACACLAALPTLFFDHPAARASAATPPGATTA